MIVIKDWGADFMIPPNVWLQRRGGIPLLPDVAFRKEPEV